MIHSIKEGINLVSFVTNLNASVSVPQQLHGQAHVADLAVEKAVPPPNPADSTALAVVLALVLIIKQIANQASILKV